MEFALCHVPAEWPTQDFDLVVFSELGYYFDDADLDRFIIRTAASLRSAGHLIAVHWRPDVADYPRTAATVHDRLRHDSPFVALAHYEDEHFLLDVFGASDEATLTGPRTEPTVARERTALATLHHCRGTRRRLTGVRSTTANLTPARSLRGSSARRSSANARSGPHRAVRAGSGGIATPRQAQRWVRILSPRDGVIR